MTLYIIFIRRTVIMKQNATLKHKKKTLKNIRTTRQKQKKNTK